MTTMNTNAPELLKSLGQMPSGLYVFSYQVKTDDTYRFFLASWVQQLSFEPLLISIAVGKDRDIWDQLAPGDTFGLHQIAEGHKTLLKAVSSKDPVKDLAAFDAQIKNGMYDIPTALNNIQCGFVSRWESPGDHDILVAKPSKLISSQNDTQPWVHLRKTAGSY